MSKKIAIVGGNSGLTAAICNSLANDHKLVISNIDDNQPVAALNEEHRIVEINKSFYYNLVEIISKIDFYDDLPNNTTKPKFLMERDHHIRSPRHRR